MLPGVRLGCAALAVVFGLAACASPDAPGTGGTGGAPIGGAGGGSECDPSAPLNDKGECDDGDPKTADRCDSTAHCAHTPVECDGYDSPEIQVAVCDDGDPCTADRCLAEACVNEPAATPECPVGTGGAGGGGAVCPRLSGYDDEAEDAQLVGGLSDEVGGAFGARLSDEPLSAAVACSTVVVGLANFTNPAVCALPVTVDVAAWSDAGEVDAESGSVVPATTPSTTNHLLADGVAEAFLGDPNTIVVRFSEAVTFKAGEYPFVALKLAATNLCAVLTGPTCAGAESLRYRPAAPGAGWAPLAHAKAADPPQVPDLEGMLLLGVEDCAAVP